MFVGTKHSGEGDQLRRSMERKGEDIYRRIKIRSDELRREAADIEQERRCDLNAVHRKKQGRGGWAGERRCDGTQEGGKKER